MLKTVLLLFRPYDHIFFTIPLVIVGFAMASRIENTQADLRILLILLIANISSLSFAFAINEVEDSEDDKKDLQKKNPVADGALPKSYATLLATGAFIISFYFFSLLNLSSAYTGTLMLILSFLYSFKAVRLKALPVVDLVSHGLMLSGLIFLSSFLAVSNNLRLAIPFFAGATLSSVYGQFFNQIRDFSEDKKAGLKNTSQILGKEKAKTAMYISAVLGIIFVAYSFYSQKLLEYLLPVLIVIVPVVLFFKGHTNSRGKRSNVKEADLHVPILILMNIFAFYFLLRLFVI